MRNNYNTNATFVSSNGTIQSYDDLLRGVRLYVEEKVRKGFLDEDEAKDLEQSAALKVLLCAKGFDETKSSPKSYGYLIAKGIHINSHKGVVHVPVPLSSLEMDDEDGYSYLPDEVDGYRAEEFNPEREVISNEQTSIIMGRVNRLGEKNRAVVEMTIKGFKPKEIAQTLGYTQDGTSVRLCRARAELKEELGGMLREYRKCA